MSIPGLERALQQYTLEPSEKPFDLKSVPLATTPMAEQRTGKVPTGPQVQASAQGLYFGRAATGLARTGGLGREEG